MSSGRMSGLQAKNFQAMRDIRNKSVAVEGISNLAALERTSPRNSNYGSPAKEGRLTAPVLDPKIQKKLFGKLSIQDVALFTRTGADSDLGLIEGYAVDSKLRFNFHNRDFKMPPSKMNRYIDQLMKEKAKIPSPQKYAPIRANFNDMKKKSVIFPRDRDSSFDFVIKAAKQTPGVGRYDTQNYDEKIIKPPRVNHKFT